jgi:phage/plasmid-associated DNA primase
MHLMCNTVPIIPQCDKAIKNRVRILPYLSTWTKNPPKTAEEQYKKREFLMDPFFENQIPEMASAFLFYCVKMYSVYRREGLRDPEIVIRHTNEYWEENDIYGQFVKENLEKAYENVPDNYKGDKEKLAIDGQSCITLAEMYSRFKDWHKENYANLKTPDRSIFRNEIETRVTKCLNRKFFGIKFKAPMVMDI